MNNEKIVNNAETETNFEIPPTEQEVISKLKEIAPNFEGEPSRKLEDENGLYLYEIVVRGESENEHMEYLYMRRGHYGNNQSKDTDICLAFYEDDFPIGGKILTKWENGEWHDF